MGFLRCSFGYDGQCEGLGPWDEQRIQIPALFCAILIAEEGNPEAQETMNKTNSLILRMAVLPLLALLCAVIAAGCSSDEPPTPKPSSDYNSVIINPDGTATGNAVFSRIDETTFFLDYVKYKIVDSHLEVIGCDKVELLTTVKLYADVKIDGVSLKTRIIKNGIFAGSPIQRITIPSTVTKIGDGCFKNCNSLMRVDLPENLITLGEGCFENCESLYEIAIPEATATLGDYCFKYCTSLKKIGIPHNVTTIGVGCFYACTSLEQVEFDEGIERLSAGCFYGCASLTNIKLANSISDLDEFCFASCRELRVIEFSTELDYIGDNCFNGCINIKNVTFKSDVPWLGERPFMTPYEGEYTPEAYVPFNYLDNYHNSKIRHYFYQIHGYE